MMKKKPKKSNWAIRLDFEENRMKQDGQFLTFTLRQQTYGVSVDCVKEINRMTEITPVPNSDECIKGVINLRGKVIPVVDLRIKFKIPESEYSKNTCIIIIEGKSGEVGIIVDSVNAVILLDKDHIEPAPVLSQNDETSFVIGMGKSEEKVVILVDIIRCVAKENLNKVIEIAQSEKTQAA
jgi:purine-binding chemotaxis protein CheW